MVLESTMICVDDSDYMRNGDFPPTRLLAQQDAVYMLTRSKLRSHPENKVGLLSLVNQEVLMNLTNDIGRLYSKLHSIQPNGKIDLYRGIKTAHLALKHREAKNHKTRIIVFVASPVTNEENKLLQLAKQLKKEKVTVDIISFGEDKVNNDTLNEFISTLNGKDGTNNHLITIAEGRNISDTLLTTPLLESAAAAESLLEQTPMDIGFDYEDDPELAMALFLSLREEEARINRANAANAVTQESNESMDHDEQNNAAVDDIDFSQLTDGQQLIYAIRMSLQNEHNSVAENVEFLEMLNDPIFIENFINNYPELDLKLEDVSEAVQTLYKNNKFKEDENDEEEH
ncbi:26S proteasome non-ATPase regulatory subunit 4-like [Diorhabda carinulata]|uniref:26S proteasome non-ATPase regulatory subunit 4-like n=1 Tax=Diorhabda carinulata TaxID=1163345 RepID=UPI0025A15777|nr:26S proteasome non-ATPase regulatory subunit 4-like [Diorhabda carinulata]